MFKINAKSKYIWIDRQQMNIEDFFREYGPSVQAYIEFFLKGDKVMYQRYEIFSNDEVILLQSDIELKDIPKGSIIFRGYPYKESLEDVTK